MKLIDFIEFNPKETIKKGTMAKKIAMDKLEPYKREIKDNEVAPFSGGSKFRNGDTLMARITPCLENGKTAQVSILDKHEIGFGSTEFIVMREKEDVSINDFIYYLALSPQIRDKAIKSMVGSSGRQRVQQDVLANIEFELPSLEIQGQIAQILSSIDEKIEINNKINDNLEQQAQAIFKSWFVDFEPFGGVMPVDWTTSNLLGIADYINGLAMQKYRPQETEDSFPVLKIKELRQGSCDNSSDRCTKDIKSDYIVHDGDVIFSWSGSLMLDFWCGDTCGLNQHLFKVTSSKYDKWFYYFWTNFHLQKFIAIAEAKATTMGHIKRGELETSEVLIPNSASYKQLSNNIQPMLDLIIERRIENRNLAQLRDTLLPKLMSGEIDVSQVEI